MISNSLKMMVDRDTANTIDYSTTEQDTGRKWIDGKPIYQKTFSVNYTFDNSTTNKWVTISEVSINNIENIIDYSMIGIDYADSIQSPSVLRHPVFMRYLLTNAYMQVYFTQRYDFILKAVTVWYTKTTDTVG